MTIKEKIVVMGMVSCIATTKTPTATRVKSSSKIKAIYLVIMGRASQLFMGVLLQIFLHRSTPKRDRQAWSGHARGAVMRLILIWLARAPLHVQLWEFFENEKGVTKKLS